MTTNLRKTFGHAGIYSIGILLNQMVSFIMLPVYTRHLTPEDYGVLQLLEITVDLVSIFAGMGIMQGMAKFYYGYDNPRDRNELVSTLFLSILALYALGSLAGISGSQWISYLVFSRPDYSNFIAISFLNLFLGFLFIVPCGYFRTLQKSLPFVLASLAKLLIQLSLNILFVVYLKKGVAGVLFSTMIASGVLGVILTFYIFRKVSIRFSAAKARDLFRFGYPFIFSGIGAFVLTFSDRFFLNHYSDMAAVGLYSLGYKLGTMVAIFPIRPLLSIWLPQRFEIVRQADYEEVFNRFLLWFVIASSAIALLIALSARDVLKIMADQAFWSAYAIVPIVLLAYLLQGLTDFFNFGIQHSGKTKHMAYGTNLSAIFILIISFPLIGTYGAFGAAWATLAAFALRLAYVYIASQSLFRIRYHLHRPALALFLAVSFSLLGLLAGETGDWMVNLVISSALFSAFVGLLFGCNVIRREEARAVLRPVYSLLAR